MAYSKLKTGSTKFDTVGQQKSAKKIVSRTIRFFVIFLIFSVSDSFNPFPNKPWFLQVCNSGLLKTLWEKEKLLVMSNFSFSHSVFYLFGELVDIFIKLEIVLCKHFEFGRV